jgi:hypothetical protein
MTQVTWRAPRELIERVQQIAKREGMSMNEYLTQVLDAATNPELAGASAARTRERLERAGLLFKSPGARVRPDPEAVARAGRVAAEGTPSAEIVSEGRGPR